MRAGSPDVIDLQDGRAADRLLDREVPLMVRLRLERQAEAGVPGRRREDDSAQALLVGAVGNREGIHAIEGRPPKNVVVVTAAENQVEGERQNQGEAVEADPAGDRDEIAPEAGANGGLPVASKIPRETHPGGYVVVARADN